MRAGRAGSSRGEAKVGRRDTMTGSGDERDGIGDRRTRRPHYSLAMATRRCRAPR